MYQYIFVAFCLIILTVYSSKYIIKHTEQYNTKFIIHWFTFLVILNIIITTFIVVTYKNIKFAKGPKGPKGLRGKDGFQGRNGSCVMCKPDMTGLKKQRPSNLIDTIDPMHQDDEKKLFTRRKKNSNKSKSN